MSRTIVSAINRGTFKLADWTLMPKRGRKQQQQPQPQSVAQPLPLALAAAEETLFTTPNYNPDHNPDLGHETSLETVAVAEHDLATELAAAIKSVAHDLRSDRPKRYTYEEWTRFTTLIRFSRRRQRHNSNYSSNNPNPNNSSSGSGSGSGSRVHVHVNEETSSTHSGGSGGGNKSNSSSSDDREDLVEWDWIGEDSPMLADITEAEWVLDRLCESLNRYTKRQAEKVCVVSIFIPFTTRWKKRRSLTYPTRVAA